MNSSNIFQQLRAYHKDLTKENPIRTNLGILLLILLAILVIAIIWVLIILPPEEISDFLNLLTKYQ